MTTDLKVCPVQELDAYIEDAETMADRAECAAHEFIDDDAFKGGQVDIEHVYGLVAWARSLLEEARLLLTKPEDDNPDS